MANRKYVKKPKTYNDGLVDLRDITIDSSLPVEDKIKSYIKQIKNPYKYRVGEIVVTLKFNKSGPSFKEAFASVLKFYNR